MDEVVSYVSDILSFIEHGSFSLDFVDDILSWIEELFSNICDFIFAFLFIDLWESCQNFGNHIFTTLFDYFSKQTFSFHSVEYVIGFIFVVFAFKFTLRVIRG